MENIEIDTEEYAKQYAEEAEKDGIVAEIYLTSISPEDFNGDNGARLCTPLCQLRGKGSAINIAALVRAMREFADNLLEDDDIRRALAIIELSSSKGETIDVLGGKNDKNK